MALTTITVWLLLSVNPVDSDVERPFVESVLQDFRSLSANTSTAGQSIFWSLEDCKEAKKELDAALSSAVKEGPETATFCVAALLVSEPLGHRS